MNPHLFAVHVFMEQQIRLIRNQQPLRSRPVKLERRKKGQVHRVATGIRRQLFRAYRTQES